MRTIKEKKERALGVRLFLKGERCASHKCVMIRKPYPPGQHGQKRKRRPSDFARQLKEKQKIQVTYGLTNRQMRILFNKHSGSPDKLVAALEKRLDRVVFLLGLTSSSRVARQIISHGHILVGDKKVSSPSYAVKNKDIITIKQKSRSLKLFEGLSEKLKKHEPPKWLQMDAKELKGTCIGDPQEDAILPFDINLVGEHYTR